MVIDSKGNIYYTDLKNIYKIDNEGNKKVVVEGVHSHEISIDAYDNIYGEHLWYNGEALDTWGHYVWCLKNNGELIKVIEPREGFLNNYGFLRDSCGNMYWIERFTKTKFRKKDLNGNITTIAEGKFRDVRWSYCTRGGTIYFVDLDKLYRLDKNGNFTLMAEGLAESGTLFGMLSDKKHHVYGIWTDSVENVYVALLDAGKVIMIDADGKKKTIVKTDLPWKPTNGLFDKEGNLWLLEFTNSKSRVRKISSEELVVGSEISGPDIMNYAIPAGIAAVIIVMISWGLGRSYYQRKFDRSPVNGSGAFPEK